MIFWLRISPGWSRVGGTIIYIYVINTFNRSDPQSQGKRIFLFHLHLRTLSTSATPDSIYIFPIIKAIKCGNLS